LSSSETKEQLEQEKEIVAHAAIGCVKSGMKLGLGSGSTSDRFIRMLGDRVRVEQLKVEAVASSKQSEKLAREVGIPLVEPKRGLRLDFAFDGADEIGPDLSLIKGGGGAHLREKVVAGAADYFLVMGDSSKLVNQLGTFPVPLEVVPFAAPWVMDRIEGLGGTSTLRFSKDSPSIRYLTDQGNYVLDCRFGEIGRPAELASSLEKIPGIVAHGLFIGYAKAALIARGGAIYVLRRDGSFEPLADSSELP
jgi:ribose 5-phosphate isomerase A